MIKEALEVENISKGMNSAEHVEDRTGTSAVFFTVFSVVFVIGCLYTVLTATGDVCGMC